MVSDRKLKERQTVPTLHRYRKLNEEGRAVNVRRLDELEDLGMIKFTAKKRARIEIS